jgi:hypothetical protein
LGREADHSPPSNAEVKEWVELYLHSPTTPSWRGVQSGGAQGNFTFTLYRTDSISQFEVEISCKIKFVSFEIDHYLLIRHWSAVAQFIHEAVYPIFQIFSCVYVLFCL